MRDPFFLSKLGKVLECPPTSFPPTDKFVPLMLSIRLKRLSYVVCAPSAPQMLFYFSFLMCYEGGLPHGMQEVAVPSNGLDMIQIAPFCTITPDKALKDSLVFSVCNSILILVQQQT